MNGLLNQNIIKDSSVCYDGFFKLNKLTIQYTKFNGELSRVHSREVLFRNPTAGVLLYDKNNNTVLLTEQFRIGALACDDHPWVYELPAGIIETGESASTAVRRETQEETGYQVNDLEFIGEFYLSPGGTSEKSSVFFAEVNLDQSGMHGELSENEDIKTHIIKLDEALEWIGQKTLSASAAIALLWLSNRLSSDC